MLLSDEGEWFFLCCDVISRNHCGIERTLITSNHQEPLYLPAGSELRVDLWRLTGANKVWYEWYAEAFLPVQQQPTASVAALAPPMSGGSVFGSASANHTHTNFPRSASPSPRVNGAGTLTLVAPSTPTSMTRSPLVDAVDLSYASDRSASPERDELGAGVVKIGQTSLHNPGGRSSWYGL